MSIDARNGSSASLPVSSITTINSTSTSASFLSHYHHLLSYRYPSRSYLTSFDRAHGRELQRRWRECEEDGTNINEEEDGRKRRRTSSSSSSSSSSDSSASDASSSSSESDSSDASVNEDEEEDEVIDNNTEEEDNESADSSSTSSTSSSDTDNDDDYLTLWSHHGMCEVYDPILDSAFLSNAQNDRDIEPDFDFAGVLIKAVEKKAMQGPRFMKLRREKVEKKEMHPLAVGFTGEEEEERQEEEKQQEQEQMQNEYNVHTTDADQSLQPLVRDSSHGLPSSILDFTPASYLHDGYLHQLTLKQLDNWTIQHFYAVMIEAEQEWRDSEHNESNMQLKEDNARISSFHVSPTSLYTQCPRRNAFRNPSRCGGLRKQIDFSQLVEQVSEWIVEEQMRVEEEKREMEKEKVTAIASSSPPHQHIPYSLRLAKTHLHQRLIYSETRFAYFITHNDWRGITHWIDVEVPWQRTKMNKLGWLSVKKEDNRTTAASSFSYARHLLHSLPLWFTRHTQHDSTSFMRHLIRTEFARHGLFTDVPKMENVPDVLLKGNETADEKWMNNDAVLRSCVELDFEQLMFDLAKVGCLYREREGGELPREVQKLKTVSQQLPPVQQPKQIEAGTGAYCRFQDDDDDNDEEDHASNRRSTASTSSASSSSSTTESTSSSSFSYPLLHPSPRSSLRHMSLLTPSLLTHIDSFTTQFSSLTDNTSRTSLSALLPFSSLSPFHVWYIVYLVKKRMMDLVTNYLEYYQLRESIERCAAFRKLLKGGVAPSSASPIEWIGLSLYLIRASGKTLSESIPELKEYANYMNELEEQEREQRRKECGMRTVVKVTSKPTYNARSVQQPSTIHLPSVASSISTSPSTATATKRDSRAHIQNRRAAILSESEEKYDEQPPASLQKKSMPPRPTRGSAAQKAVVAPNGLTKAAPFSAAAPASTLKTAPAAGTAVSSSPTPQANSSPSSSSSTTATTTLMCLGARVQLDYVPSKAPGRRGARDRDASPLSTNGINSTSSSLQPPSPFLQSLDASFAEFHSSFLWTFTEERKMFWKEVHGRCCTSTEGNAKDGVQTFSPSPTALSSSSTSVTTSTNTSTWQDEQLFFARKLDSLRTELTRSEKELIIGFIRDAGMRASPDDGGESEELQAHDQEIKRLMKRKVKVKQEE